MEFKLKAEKRDGTGKGAARRMRAAGRVPAVLYGHGVEPTPLSLDARDLYHALHAAGGSVVVDLVVDGQEHLVLPREVQRDHIRGRYLHVDFFAVRRDVDVKVEVPVRLVGEAPGVKQGGVLEHHLWDVQVQCRPDRVPEAIEADVSALEIGDSLRVGALRETDGVTILTNPHESVVSLVMPQVLRVEEEVVEEEVAEEEVAEEEAAEAGAEGAPPEEGGEG